LSIARKSDPHDSASDSSAGVEIDSPARLQISDSRAAIAPLSGRANLMS